MTELLKLEPNKHCQFCKLRKPDFDLGTVCSLTGRKPDFHRTCVNFQASEIMKTEFNRINQEYQEEMVNKRKVILS